MVARAFGIVAMGGLVALAACHRQPTGQVVAKVGSEEVTLQELNTELQNTNLPPKPDKDLVQRQLVQRIVERKLIDHLAQQKGLDKTSDFIAQQRRTEDILLAQAYAKQTLAAVPLPSEGGIAAFMASNPGSFSQRQQLILDQIRFPIPQNPQALKGIESTHSLEAVAAFLTAKGIKFDRGTAGLDSSTVPTAMLAQINGLPGGEPFVVPTGGLITVNVLTGRKPIANDPTQARAAAVSAWRQQQVQERMAADLRKARGDVKITYQKGFEPVTAPTSGAKPGGAAK